MPRDSQRQKVYNAERVLDHSPSTLEHDRRERLSPTVYRTYASQETCQAFVDRVVRSRFWGSMLAKTTRSWLNGPPRKVTVGPGKGHRKATAYGLSHIELPIWARKDWVILHELAHCLTDAMYARTAPHGREFCSVYLKLVKRFLGDEWAEKLKESFREHRVKWTLPRRSPTAGRRAA